MTMTVIIFIITIIAVVFLSFFMEDLEPWQM